MQHCEPLSRVISARMWGKFSHALQTFSSAGCFLHAGKQGPEYSMCYVKKSAVYSAAICGTPHAEDVHVRTSPLEGVSWTLPDALSGWGCDS